MRAEVRKVIPNFAEGWNGAADPTDLPDNAFMGKNLVPSRFKSNAVEKVRVRQQDLLVLSDNSIDDRGYIASGYSDKPNQALNVPGVQPNFDNIEDVFYFTTNAWSMTSVTTAAAPTDITLWHTTKANLYVKIGFRLERAVKVTSTKSLIISIPMKRYAGAYDSTRYSLTATIYPVQTTGTPPSAVSGLTTCVFTDNIYPSAYSWVDLHFQASSSDVSMLPGEYYVKITDSSSSGSNATNHYILGLADTASDPNGFAIVTNDSATTKQAVHSVMVWQKNGTNATKTAQDNVTLSPAIAHAGFRPYYTTTTDNGVSAAADVTEDTRSFFFSDRFSIYSVYPIIPDQVRETFSAANQRKFSTILFNTTLALDPTLAAAGGYRLNYKMIGRVEAMTTYQQYFVMGGIGGIAVCNTTLNAGDLSFAGPAIYNTAVPDIGNRVDTQDYEWVTTYSKAADVHPPVVSNVFVAGINPGRIFATIGNTIIWSGGTTAATTGNPASWSTFAVVSFGDTSDRIQKACWFHGYIFLFTQQGHVYYMTGEPPVDPTYGYGTLRADYLGKYGICTALEVNQDGVWFATENGTQLWVMGLDLVPKRLDHDNIGTLSVNNIVWDAAQQRIWVASDTHTKRSYLTTTTDDSTIATEYEYACSYMFDYSTRKWFRVQRPYDTDTTANQPATFLFGAGAWKIGDYIETRKTAGTYTYTDLTRRFNPTFTTGAITDVTLGSLVIDVSQGYVGIVSQVGNPTFDAYTQGGGTSYPPDEGSFYTIKRTPYCVVQWADDLLHVYDTTANTADPENSDYRAVTVTADLYTKEYDLTEESGLAGAMGVLKEMSLAGTLYSGSTITVYAVAQDGTENQIASFSGDQTWTSPTTQIYRLPGGAMDRTGSIRLRISISGKYKDEIRNVALLASVYGSKVGAA